MGMAHQALEGVPVGVHIQEGWQRPRLHWMPLDLMLGEPEPLLQCQKLSRATQQVPTAGAVVAAPVLEVGISRKSSAPRTLALHHGMASGSTTSCRSGSAGTMVSVIHLLPPPPPSPGWCPATQRNPCWLPSGAWSLQGRGNENKDILSRANARSLEPIGRPF